MPPRRAALSRVLCPRAIRHIDLNRGSIAASPRGAPEPCPRERQRCNHQVSSASHVGTAHRQRRYRSPISMQPQFAKFEPIIRNLGRPRYRERRGSRSAGSTFRKRGPQSKCVITRQPMGHRPPLRSPLRRSRANGTSPRPRTRSLNWSCEYWPRRRHRWTAHIRDPQRHAA